MTQQPHLKHQLGNKLKLVALKLSRCHSASQDFQKNLLTSSQPHGGMELQNNISCISADGCLFVSKGRYIFFTIFEWCVTFLNSTLWIRARMQCIKYCPNSIINYHSHWWHISWPAQYCQAVHVRHFKFKTGFAKIPGDVDLVLVYLRK